MFEFESPQFLFLLLLLPVIFLVSRKKKMRPAMRVSSARGLSGIRKSPALRISQALGLLKYAALILMILAVARPRLGTTHETVLTKGVNIVIALDTSASMAALDFKKDGKIVNRLMAVKGVVDGFVGERSGDRVGLVVFGTRAFTQLPLTRDYSTISFMLDRLEIGAAGKQTAIGDAIGISLKRLEDIDSKSNIIILLTDGENTAGSLSPGAAAEIAARRGVKIYTIGAGSRGKAPFLVKDPIFGERYVYQKVSMDEDTLKEVAKKTGGLYFRAENTEGLKRIYETIDRMEKTEVKVRTFTEYREYYGGILIPAFVLLALFIVLSNTRFLKIP